MPPLSSSALLEKVADLLADILAVDAQHALARLPMRDAALREATDALIRIFHEGLVEYLGGPAPAGLVAGHVEDVLRALVLCEEPDQAEDGVREAEDDGDDEEDPLVGLPDHVLADADANEETHESPADVRGVADILAVGGQIAGDIARDQHGQQDEGGQAELLLAPVHDQVRDMDPDQRIAAARAAHHRDMAIQPEVGEGASDDAGVEHGGEAQVPVHALQRNAQHHVEEYVHQDVLGADMRPLVRQPPPDLRAIVLAFRAIQPQVRALFEE
mmetsp:Transcript_18398/g.52761  ORF Transcript_18398/g.52761 Transcript_18398/m.52761 type:complete len:273 (+) Transcript_18398:162-980(+)